MAKRQNESERPEDNFRVVLDDVLTPGGVYAPPTSDYILILIVHVQGRADPQRLALPFRDLDGANFEKLVPGCVYGCNRNRREVSQDIRQELIGCLSYKRPSNQYPVRGGWNNLPAPTFWLGQEFIPAIDNDLLNVFTRTMGTPIHLVGGELMEVDALKMLATVMLTHPDLRIPTFSFTVASYLKSVWEQAELPLRSTLFIYGKSGFGKSSLAHTFSALCNGEDGKPADALSLESTVAATINHCSKVRDRVVLLDDICRSTDPQERRRCMATAMQLLRYASGELSVSKMKGNSDIQRKMEFGLVITSEILPQELSELTRCIVIHMTEEHSGGNEAEREMAAACLRGYLAWFANHYEQETANIADQICELRPNPYPGYERLFKGIFQLAWCWDSFCRYAKDQGVAMPQYDTCFRETMEHQIDLIEGGTRKLINVIATIYQQLKETNFHKGCVCVKLNELIFLVNGYMGRQDLRESDISVFLRAHRMVAMDASERVTKKIGGHRYIHLLPPQYWI